MAWSSIAIVSSRQRWTLKNGNFSSCARCTLLAFRWIESIIASKKINFSLIRKIKVFISVVVFTYKWQREYSDFTSNNSLKRKTCEIITRRFAFTCVFPASIQFNQYLYQISNIMFVVLFSNFKLYRQTREAQLNWYA